MGAEARVLWAHRRQKLNEITRSLGTRVWGANLQGGKSHHQRRGGPYPSPALSPGCRRVALIIDISFEVKDEFETAVGLGGFSSNYRETCS